MSQFITTTALNLMRPLGSPAERSLPRLQAILDREFKGGLRFTLAEPVQRKDGSGIDWYTDNDDTLTPLAKLPPELSDYYRARLKSDVDMVMHAVQGYETRQDPKAKSLRNAVTYPGDDNIWIAGDPTGGQASIILTAWGHEAHAPDSGVTDITRPAWLPPATPVDIAKHGDAEQAISEQAKTEPVASPLLVERAPLWRRIVFWSAWLLVPILALAIGWLLLPACGLRLPFSTTVIYGWGDGAFCRQVANPQARQGDNATRGLTAELAIVEEQLRALLAQCIPAPVQREEPAEVPVVPKKNDVEIRDDADKILEQHGIRPGVKDSDVTLIWNNTNDLDLYVVCPNGSRVPLGRAACGAQHLLDMNPRVPLVSNPVEHVSWGAQTLQPGHYRIEVEYYRNNPPSEIVTPFTVILHRNGKYQTEHGTASQVKEVVKVVEFDAP